MPQASKRALIVLLLLVPAPTIGTLAAMWFPATHGTPMGQAIYALCKLWGLVLPLWWWLRLEKQPLSLSPARKGGFATGIGLGLLMGLVIYGIWWVLGADLIDAQSLREKVAGNGLDTPQKYLVYVTFLSLVNSLLEEYVWRWFVFRQCEQLVSTKMAMVLSALFFTIHHIFALKAQMNGTVTLLGSVGIFSAGLIWCWCYGRYRSIWPGYVSHLLADAAIFIIGWQIIF